MAQTKAEWRKGLLRFHNAPMFTATGKMSTRVHATGAEATAGKVAVSQPIYAGTFTTEGTQHFRVFVGGVVSSSSAGLMAKLRWGTGVILQVSANSSVGTKVLSTKVPFQFEFNGRVVTYSTLAKIAASGRGQANWQSGALDLYKGTTGASAEYASSDHNLASNAATGLNVLIAMDTTRGGGAGAKSFFSINNAYIQLFD